MWLIIVRRPACCLTQCGKCRGEAFAARNPGSPPQSSANASPWRSRRAGFGGGASEIWCWGQGEASAVRALCCPAMVRRMLRPYNASVGLMAAGRIFATPPN